MTAMPTTTTAPGIPAPAGPTITISSPDVTGTTVYQSQLLQVTATIALPAGKTIKTSDTVDFVLDDNVRARTAVKGVSIKQSDPQNGTATAWIAVANAKKGTTTSISATTTVVGLVGIPATPVVWTIQQVAWIVSGPTSEYVPVAPDDNQTPVSGSPAGQYATSFTAQVWDMSAATPAPLEGFTVDWTQATDVGLFGTDTAKAKMKAFLDPNGPLIYPTAPFPADTQFGWVIRSKTNSAGIATLILVSTTATQIVASVNGHSGLGMKLGGTVMVTDLDDWYYDTGPEPEIPGGIIDFSQIAGDNVGVQVPQYEGATASDTVYIMLNGAAQMSFNWGVKQNFQYQGYFPKINARSNGAENSLQFMVVQKAGDVYMSPPTTFIGEGDQGDNIPDKIGNLAEVALSANGYSIGHQINNTTNKYTVQASIGLKQEGWTAQTGDTLQLTFKLNGYFTDTDIKKQGVLTIPTAPYAITATDVALGTKTFDLPQRSFACYDSSAFGDNPGGVAYAVYAFTRPSKNNLTAYSKVYEATLDTVAPGQSDCPGPDDTPAVRTRNRQNG